MRKALLLAVLALAVAAPAEATHLKCKVKVYKKTGVLLVDVRNNLTGNVLWGNEVGDITNTFFNAPIFFHSARF